MYSSAMLKRNKNIEEVLSSSCDGRPCYSKVGRQVRGYCAPFSEGVGSTFNVARPAEAYLRTKWYPFPSSRLARIDMSRKVGAAVPPLGGGGQMGSYVTQCRLGRGLPPY